MPELNPNQVALSDGRVVTMRETTGADEMAASAMLGKHFTQDAAGINLYSKALAHRAITDVDGSPLHNGPIKFDGFRSFWGSTKTRDGQRILKKYTDLNGDPDDPLDVKDASDSLLTLPDSEKQ